MSASPQKPRLWKKPSLDWLNKPHKGKQPTLPGSPLRVNLDSRSSKESESESEGSPRSSRTVDKLTSPVGAPNKANVPNLGDKSAANHHDAHLQAVGALSSKETLKRMLDDPKCLWKFGQFVSFDIAAETLIFYLNAEQHRQDLQRLHALTRRVHALHVPTTAALALNISATERCQLEEDSASFLKLQDPFETARDAALDVMLRDTWPRFIRHRLELLYDLELRTLDSASTVALATSFCVSSVSAEDDYAILAVSDGFTAVTGYTRKESIGRNCRFLRGPGTDVEACDRIATACHEGVSIEELLLNYRSDGAPFQNFVRITPLRDAKGTIVAMLGYQVNVDSREGLGPLLDDRLDQFDERMPTVASKPQQDQQKQAADAFAKHIQNSRPELIGSVTREMRLNEAAMLALGHTARKGEAKAARDAASIKSRAASKAWKRASSTSMKSVTTMSDSMDQMSLFSGATDAPSEGHSIGKQANSRWLYLDAAGAAVLHSCQQMQPLFAPGVEFISAVKRDNPNLIKRLKAVVKSGDSAHERARLPMDGQRPDRVSDVTVALVPIKGKDGKAVGIVVLCGMSGC